MPKINRLLIRAQGISVNMYALPEIWTCGDIDDGVVIGFEGDPGPHVAEGAWTISFEDLEKLYLVAVDVRKPDMKDGILNEISRQHL